MNEYACKLKFLKMEAVGRYETVLTYDDGSRLSVIAAMDGSYHYVNGEVGSLVPMDIPRLWPLNVVAIWHEADLC